jgi:cytochrome c-type biogenesis protein CcmF
MIPEVGHFALIVALCLAVIQTVFPIAGAFLGRRSWMALARPVAHGQFVFVALAFACLTYVFINKDYSVLYAANHSNSQLPLIYRIAGVWGGHEGSLLLWVFFLNVWTVAVTLFGRNLDNGTFARVVGVLGGVSIGFLTFLLFTSNPFERLIPAAPDGRDLNPLLQDPGLAIHPPMLYMGYVGFSVAFAFAIAALLSGKLDAAWARWSRPWTTAAWIFLTLGIGLGSWWAYYELGWGGWWFWDPVENASFLPWLLGTALLHSLAVTDKRGTFRNWTVLLAIGAFSLSLLGTFLVRSGVLVSVHAFATDPSRGLFILVLLGVYVGLSLALFAWRAPKVGFGGDFKLVSRETMLLTGNVMLSVAAGAVLLGTLYPLINDALGLGKISVGPPYFDTVFLPLMVPVIFLMGVGPLARWKQASVPELRDILKWALLAGVIAAIVFPLIMGSWRPMVALGVLMAFWLFASAVANITHRIRSLSGSQTVLQKLRMQPRQYYGMLVAHSAVGVFVLGVTMVNGYQEEKDVRMDLGDQLTMGPYTFRFEGTVPVEGPNYRADRGTITVFKSGSPFVVLHPEKRTYRVQQQPMTEAAIDSGIFRQLYVSLGEPVGAGAWSVRVYYKPFVTWIWLGCFLMGVGGLLAMTDRRYRLATQRSTSKVVADGATARGAA